MFAYITVTTITAGSWKKSFESEPYLAPLSDLVMESAWERAFDFLNQKEDVIRQQKDSRVTATKKTGFQAPPFRAAFCYHCV